MPFTWYLNVKFTEECKCNVKTESTYRKQLYSLLFYKCIPNYVST